MASRDRVEREKAEHRKRREELILNTAEKLFLEKGFIATTIGDIAAGCELTNGAIYLYYKNKNELILKVMTGISLSFGDLLNEKAEETKSLSGFKQVEKLLGIYNRSYSEFRSYHLLDAQFNLMFCEAYPDTPLLAEYFQANQRVLEILSEAVGKGMGDGSIKSRLSARRTAGLLLNTVNSYVEKISIRKKLMEEEQGIRMEEELRSFIDLLISALTAE
ncbi:MAG: TetR/AcrR family transcriptional regulator [Spirochaetales bacterium]|nr:TetR/AcrR family transcriptional regulator [Spirochaetales bacterium]